MPKIGDHVIMTEELHGQQRKHAVFVREIVSVWIRTAQHGTAAGTHALVVDLTAGTSCSIYTGNPEIVARVYDSLLFWAALAPSSPTRYHIQDRAEQIIAALNEEAPNA